MNSNELRKGNYVMHKERGMLPITAYAIHLFEKEWIMKTKTYEPITITYEVLFKFGFTKEVDVNGNEFYEHEMDIQADFKNNRIWFGTNEFYLNDVPVHRMQNICYALTMKELKMILS